MAKISVLTATCRPWDMLLHQAKDLEAQTFRDFDWVIVDDLLHPDCPNKRDVQLHASFSITHVPPRVYSEKIAEAVARNTCLIHATGELVYFMNDYIRPAPGVLQRHWQIYQEYGPKVMISGPLEPEQNRRPETMIGDGVGEVLSDHLMGGYYWAGRNDSAPLEGCLAVNGFDERADGDKGGIDVILARHLANWGCRYLFDTLISCREEQHHPAKAGIGGHYAAHWDSLYQDARNTKAIWTPNSWSIEDERAEHFGNEPPNSPG